MRTYVDIYKDFCKWYVKHTKDYEMSYETLLDKYNEKTLHGMLFKTILEMCYDKDNGLYYFCKFIIGDLQEIGYPTKFRYNKLLREWDKKIKQSKLLAVLCARGHGKSVFFTQILSIYDMFLFKHRRIIIISASQDQANRLLEEAKTIIENNEWLIAKRNPNKWANQTIGYNGGYIFVAGIGSEIRGHHVDRIVCVPGWTMIDTENGEKRIDTIKNGDFVRTHKGRFKKVSKIYHRYNTGNIRRIKTKYHKLLITDNHPVLTDKGWIHAKNVRKGDTIYWKDSPKKYKKIHFINKKITNRKYIKTIVVDEFFSRFLGLFAAEGSCRNGNTISLTFNNNETEFIEFSKNMLKTMGIKSYIDTHNSWATTVIGYSKSAHDTFKSLFNKGAKNKKIPKIIFDSPASVRAQFILALLEGDATKHYNGKSFTLGVSSKQLRDDCVLLSNTLSITPSSIKEYEHKQGYKKSFSVIGGKSYRCHFKVGQINKLKAIKEKSRHTVLSNEKTRNFTGDLYNLEVEDDNSYVANGITVHNCDDILRSDNKMRDIEIEDFLDMTLMPMILNRNGQIILVGTPVREKDIFSNIEYRIKTIDNCAWKLYKYPAIIDEEKKLLQCPDRFTWQEIMDKKYSMGNLKFSREYQLEFFSRDSSLFPARIVEPAKIKGKELTLENKASKRSPNWMYVIGVDVARSGSVSADYTVAIVLAYDSVKQEKQIVHIWREKGLKISEQTRYIAELSKKFNNCMVVVETNNMGQEMVDQLIDDYNVFVEPYTVGGAAKKEELIRFLIRAFETEQLVIPQGDEDARYQMTFLEDELSKYCVTITPAGNERFEGVGSHDDCVSALALANKGTQIGGVPFAVKDFGGNNQYSAFIQNAGNNETDIVQKIKMGLIK